MTTETPAIPVTIIGGYLGAGKTTLLNTLLRGDHGLRLAILVNDFGSINIDAALIAIHDGETISLTNGCVCCSMVDNLAITLLELLGREPPPDQIVIEASGVADPHRIVFYGAADPRLRLDGLIVVADAETLPLRLRDKYIGELVMRQLVAADLIIMSKVDLIDEARLGGVRELVREIAPRAKVVEAIRGDLPADLLLGIGETRVAASSPFEVQHGHDPPATRQEHDDLFARWSFVSGRPFDRERLLTTVESLPPSVLRAKGLLYVAGDPAHSAVLQLVGRRWTLEVGSPWSGADRRTRLVVIGPSGSLDTAQLTEDFSFALADDLRS
jgi:G3E family GTPase